MSMRDTVARDYMVAAHDDAESVTFTSENGPGGSAAYELVNTVGEDLTAREIGASAGMYQQGDRRWQLPRVQIDDPDHYPKPGDRLTDEDGTEWYILDATLDSLGIAFSVTGRQGR